MNMRLMTLFTGDLACALTAFYLAGVLLVQNMAGMDAEHLPSLILMGSCLVMIMAAGIGLDVYNARRSQGVGGIALRVLILVAACLGLMGVLHLGGFIARADWIFATLSLLTFGVFQLTWHAFHAHIPLGEARSQVLILGTGPLAMEMGSLISGEESPQNLLGYISCASERVQVNEKSIRGDERDILETVQRLKANTVVVSLSERRGVFPLQELLSCKLSGVEVLDAPSFYERVTRKLLLENITPGWFIFSHGFRITNLRRAIKRLLDIAASLVGLALTLPLYPFIALAIKLDSPGPVFFRQERVGQGDKPFVLTKFRSMRADAEKGTGAVWSTENDPRVTRLGRFLRKSRLDEIPQLLNVLAGEMSLVGPRPERPEFVSNLKRIIPYYSERHYVKPGVTGWAQVCYPYGSSVEDAIEKLRYDMYYIKNLSVSLDLSVIFRTIGVVLLGRGGR